MFSPKALDIFRLPLVHPCKLVPSLPMDMEQLIEFDVNRLRVAMFSPLDKQGHEPGTKGRRSVPVERMWLKNNP
jgi:hypothetical protein